MSIPDRNIAEAVIRAIDDMDNVTPSQDRHRPYKGQPHTDDGKRGETLVEGLTMRDIRDCLIRAFMLSHRSFGDDEEAAINKPYYDEACKGEGASVCPADVFKLSGDIDYIAVSQNLTCEIEKMMGIFPNIDKQLHKTTLEELGITPTPPEKG